MFYARSEEIQRPCGLIAPAGCLNYDDAHEEAIAGDIHRIGCNLRLIGAPAREKRPGDAGELVGERDRQHVAVEPLRCLDPGPQTPYRGARASHQQHLRGLHE